MEAFRYIAQQYSARTDGPPLVLFVAPAGEIRAWAGVARKAFNYLHGFQRSLSSERVAEVAAFYKEDVRNISPTAVVIGFGPAVTITPVSSIQLGSGLQAVEIAVDSRDLSKQTTQELAAEAVNFLELRLQKEVVAAVRANLEDASTEVQSTDDDTIAGDSPDEQHDSESSNEHLSKSDRAFLEDFYTVLLGQLHGDIPWPEDSSQLREVLYSLLKPAIIVDGQHRVFGAAQFDPTMLLAVCAIPSSDWVENVYQFVVINQKAKPIRPNFLSNIIANSLSQPELDAVYDRLMVSNVDVERSQIMEIVNANPLSPFRNMIDFEVPGAPGFLGFPGMWRLSENFRRAEVFYPGILPDGWPGDEHYKWLPFFFAFWEGIRETFTSKDSRLWTNTETVTANNLLKIVTLQEMQGLTLDLWGDARQNDAFASPEAMKQAASRFWYDFPAEFFTDIWNMKGLQTQVGRKLLREAITETRRRFGSKGFKYRTLRLFTGV